MCTKIGMNYVNCKEVQDSIDEVKRLKKHLKDVQLALVNAEKKRDRLEEEHQHAVYKRF